VVAGGRGKTKILRKHIIGNRFREASRTERGKGGRSSAKRDPKNGKRGSEFEPGRSALAVKGKEEENLRATSDKWDGGSGQLSGIERLREKPLGEGETG